MQDRTSSLVQLVLLRYYISSRHIIYFFCFSFLFFVIGAGGEGQVHGYDGRQMFLFDYRQ